MNVIRPIVGEWYRGGTNELFEVVAIDDQDRDNRNPILRRHRCGNGFRFLERTSVGRFDRGRGCARRLVGRHRCRGRRSGPRVRGQRQNRLVQSARPIDAPLNNRSAKPRLEFAPQRFASAPSRAASSCSGRRKITSKNEPGHRRQAGHDKKFRPANLRRPTYRQSHRS